MIDISWYDPKRFNSPYEINNIRSVYMDDDVYEYEPEDFDAGSLLNFLILGCSNVTCDDDLYHHKHTLPVANEIIKISSSEFLNRKYEFNFGIRGMTTLHFTCGIGCEYEMNNGRRHKKGKFKYFDNVGCLQTNDKGLLPELCDTIQLLVEHGADITIKDSKGVTPLDVLYGIQEMYQNNDIDEINGNNAFLNFDLNPSEKMNVYQKSPKYLKNLLTIVDVETLNIFLKPKAIQIQKVIRGIQSRKKTAVTKRPTYYMLKKAWPEVLKSLLDDGMSKKEIKKFRDKQYFKITKQEIQDLVMATIKEKNKKIRVCCVCLSQNVNSQLKPCGHMVMCHDCAQQIKHENQRCPFCRADIETVKKLSRDKLSSASISSTSSSSSTKCCSFSTSSIC